MTRTDISEFEISMNKYEYTIDPTHKGKVYIYKRGVQKEYTDPTTKYIIRPYPKLIGSDNMSSDYKKMLYAIQRNDYDSQSIVVLESPTSN